jgi:hypothetical protein
MGRIYREQLELKIREVGVSRIRAYVNPAGFDPEYRRHIDETLTDLGVAVVTDREHANFILDGRAEPELSDDQIVAYFEAPERMIFAGSLL